MFALLFALQSFAGAAELSGVNVPDTATVGGQDLVLNGLGLREKYFIDIYVGGLYLPQKTTDSAKAIQDDVPKRITMQFTYDLSAERSTRARIAACGSASAMAGSVRARIPARGSDQPGKPPAGKSRQCSAKARTRSIANQKFGSATPIWVAPITALSAARPRRAAAMRPAGKAMAVASNSARSASGSETVRRCATSSATGTLYV